MQEVSIEIIVNKKRLFLNVFITRDDDGIIEIEKASVDKSGVDIYPFLSEEAQDEVYEQAVKAD